MTEKPKKTSTLIAENRKARYEYFILEEVEAGIVLTGTEVKSLRTGRATIADAHAGERNGEMWIFNLDIPEYKAGNRFNHEPKRPRKLLLHQKQISKLLGQVKVKGLTLVPLKMYFNDRGIAKLLLGLGKGKKEYEKRETIKKRDWEREQRELLKSGKRR
ncbi:MAG TPA: SsrA-binding protein SmpB [Rickettsiales bacterium]|nr:SsrA-binding protein SmpB [Rickettsiales bacterium]